MLLFFYSDDDDDDFHQIDMVNFRRLTRLSATPHVNGDDGFDDKGKRCALLMFGDQCVDGMLLSLRHQARCVSLLGF